MRISDWSSDVCSSDLQAGKGLRVQLGAFSNRAAATSAWSTLSGGFAELRSLSPFYVTAGEMIRLQAGPVPDRAAATRICARLTADGKGCLPVHKRFRHLSLL